jgi:hypothetical protein
MADEPQDPITSTRNDELVNAALIVEAFGEAFADFGTKLGGELRTRMVKVLQDQGIRSTWEAKGVGKIILNAPDSKLAIRGSEEAEFNAWAAKQHPEHIVATVEVLTGDLDNVLQLLDEQGYTADIKTTLTPRSAWLKNWLENGVEETLQYPDCEPECVDATKAAKDGRCPTHEPQVLYIEKATGEPVPGIFRKPAADPNITRRLDAPRKTAVREAVAAFLTDRIANGIPAGTDPLALLAGPTPTPAPSAEGDGQPAPEVDGQAEVEVPECRCGHTGGQHRKGPKQYGKCLVTECFCRRFTERTPE